jgi:hypothetical protein
VSDKQQEATSVIVEQMAESGIKLVASLPDDWIAPLREKPGGVPIDDVESKIRFGRYIEKTTGIKIFRHPALERLNP